jgi:hypothetical protein
MINAPPAQREASSPAFVIGRPPLSTAVRVLPAALLAVCAVLLDWLEASRTGLGALVALTCGRAGVRLRGVSCAPRSRSTRATT